MEISEGKPYPLGATADEKGANFAVFSANATRVEVCIFDNDGQKEREWQNQEFGIRAENESRRNGQQDQQGVTPGVSEKREGTVRLQFQTHLALCAVWRSPFTGEEVIAYGRTNEEAQRNMRLAILRELTAHGVELANNPTIEAD